MPLPPPTPPKFEVDFRIALLVLVGVEAEELHLDEFGCVELELSRRER